MNNNIGNGNGEQRKPEDFSSEKSTPARGNTPPLRRVQQGAPRAQNMPQQGMNMQPKSDETVTIKSQQRTSDGIAEIGATRQIAPQQKGASTEVKKSKKTSRKKSPGGIPGRY